MTESPLPCRDPGLPLEARIEKHTGTGGYVSVAADGVKVAEGGKVFGAGATANCEIEPADTGEALLPGVPGAGEDG